MDETAAIAWLKSCGVIPVVVIEDASRAADLAHALVAGGIDVVEVTLRRPAALAALAAIAKSVPKALAVAGTVVTPSQVPQVRDAGAQVVVSPGFSESVDEALRKAGLPWLPGVATASDCMRAVAAGRIVAKFFPAEQAGGPPALKALSGPFPQMSFCPTGGVGLKNLDDYLSLPQVICVGGSWLVPPDAIAAGDWGRITTLAREAKEAFAKARG
ncbi:bifunctional 4-hydroxy-2-oxoglutarate aldolase/2-dehydro-3-deoxy-phosphogluconate aldolase [Bosea sp. (in: a-proteobacteria)]|uniref:bifunctional 4-hydroxy-2-oxoglutarate aldolase/2-dehydro-3-deoxy-phosphogluconate aldolase n=1 Tax=Bosea sp. (in: a-proteobacteria) TaxID=1871050 RepID=UPI002606CC9B|nr:bifunctional 4-hydroxy-2-oxoglutarate aldolase/2-dehydro-3-deoxy-phosphogluconate aldolase [Bosea sp. (in: a-proteobacteria)]MCO5089400.1 bifunctional 4-hydroxy-2-oxoglutarate aldolase/2-dehydro-3-deoxy-phosphogluconate aldolase [Bosea sp. (in: a-proteobacteria)]